MTGLRSSQLAAAAGVNPQTLRYYERRGLLDEPQRSLGGHRLYPQETVSVLRVIKAAQRLGFSLDEVADLLDTGRHRHGRARAVPSHCRARVESRCHLRFEWSICNDQHGNGLIAAEDVHPIQLSRE